MAEIIHFLKSFKLIEVLSLTIAFIAIVISLISYVNDNKKNLRELRLSKLEELIELNIYFLTYYESLFDISEIRNKVIFSGEISLQSIFLEDIEGDKAAKSLIEIIGINNFVNKLSRFNVLANSYLPNGELKLKCLSLVELNANLFKYAIFKDYKVRQTHPKFPLKKVYFNYIEEVEKDLITEMKLGYKSFKDSEREKYYPTFKKEMNI
jgi:hypothetical protein